MPAALKALITSSNAGLDPLMTMAGRSSVYTLASQYAKFFPEGYSLKVASGIRGIVSRSSTVLMSSDGHFLSRSTDGSNCYCCSGESYTQSPRVVCPVPHPAYPVQVNWFIKGFIGGVPIPPRRDVLSKLFIKSSYSISNILFHIHINT